MRIDPEDPADIEGIGLVHVAAFENTEEARLVSLLREAGKAVISLVARADDGIVGNVLFSPVTIERTPGGFKAYGLAPVAVLPEFEHQGIGSALIERGLEVSRENDCDAVVVLGHTDYYPRFGFSRASDLGLDNEYGAGDAFMVLALSDRALEGVGGMVRYAPEFAAVG
jgi:putative acetyltransferase